MNINFSAFSKRVHHKLFFQQFLLLKLPSAFFAGLKIETFTSLKATVSVKQTWFTKNPFRSIYFAVLTMAGEMSSGILCMGNIYARKPAVSMLVTEQRGVFYKKATGKILFVCNEGNEIAKAVDEAVITSNAVTVVCNAKGFNAGNEMVTEFWITWSFKARNK